MRVIFSNHAKIKLQQRKINKNFVLRTLERPDFFRPGYGGRTVAYKNFGKNFMAVVFKKENETFVVVTQHWVAKVNK